jgi:D-threonate/D-erythronate kinase
MIVVIADDFTGAAELAGISLRYGLKTVICLREIVGSNADVLIVCTDSRSLNKEEAIKITSGVVTGVLKTGADFIYKKIDSVLRGHVIDELKIQMQKTGVDKTLIVPANPSLGRTISNGEYFINGKKIEETEFANDPEFPVRSSAIKDLVGDERIYVLPHTASFPGSGIVIGETKDIDDTVAWANKMDDSWMLAGSGDFYAAILNKKYKQQKQKQAKTIFPHLYVCGTAIEKSKRTIDHIREETNCVVYINRQMIEAEHTNKDKWLQKAQSVLIEQNRVVIAFDKDMPATVSAKLLRCIMARYTRFLLEKTTIRELFIEGGSTAATILNELNIKSLLPVHELQPGVVRMQAGYMYITVKPGSYELPQQIMDMYTR